MASGVTIVHAEVAALIEEAANRPTGGDKIAAVALAVSRLLGRHAISGSLLGGHAGLVTCGPGAIRLRLLSLTNSMPRPAGKSIGCGMMGGGRCNRRHC
jgi:hypothetical protein